jgi:transposase InsO family protein
MALGQQLIAPDGFGTLKKGTTYHFLVRDEDRGRVVLIGFTAKPHNAWLEYISCQAYEDGRKSSLIKVQPQEAMRRMPPWLSTYEDKHIEEELAIQYRYGFPKSGNSAGSSSEDGDKPFGPKAIVDDRQSRIRHAIENYAPIFKTHFPEKELNRFAREAKPKLKEKRFRLWVLTALGFPGNEWSLLPPPGNRGKYRRAEAKRRVGRPRLDGSQCGYNVNEDMKAKIVQGFKKYKAQGMYLNEVYADTLRYVFKCKERLGAHGLESYHPNGEPFPSEGQFRHWCYQLIGKEKVLRALIGDIEYQNKHMAPIGSYSEGTQDLLQTANTDVSHSKMHPKSVLTGVTLPKLAICKVVCPLSGMIAGVAAGFGGETTSLYLQAMFVAGIKKSKLGQILGMKIKDADWPTDLLPMNVHSDQGPGGAIDIRKIHDAIEISQSMSPAYNPRTNSPVEAKHDKSRKVAGRPSYIVSADSPLKMYRAEINSSISKNNSSTAVRRATPDQLSRDKHTPHEIYNDYYSRGRVAGVALPFDQLVKTYLPKITLRVKDGFVTYKSIRYRSSELSKTTFAKDINKFEGAKIVGYCLEISTRILWIMVNGRLIEVNAIDQVIAAADENSMTLYEHDEHGRNAGIADSHLKVARTAGRNMADKKSEADNGSKTSRGRRTEGRAKVGKRKTKAEVAAMAP